MTHIRSSILAVAALCATAAGSLAAPALVIDDFKTGTFFLTVPPGPPGAVTKFYSGGGIIGGSRRVVGLISSNNPFAQSLIISDGIGVNNAHVPPALVYSVGYGLYTRMEIGWGYGNPMSVDLSKYAAIRVTFVGITTALNFNFEAYTGTQYVQWSCNLNPTPPGGNPVTVDLPIPQGTKFDYAAINKLYLIAQDSNDFAIGQIVAIPPGTAPASTVCPL